MLNSIYYVLFLLSLVFTIILVARYRERISAYYVLMFGSILVANFGYMLLSDTRTLEAAVRINYVVYLGSSFAPFFLLMCLADLCRIRVKWIYQALMLMCAGVVLFLACTVEKYKIYYKNVTLIRENGVTRLVKEYGPLHPVYLGYLYGLVLLGLIFVLLSFRKKRDVSYITSIWLLVVLVFTITIYVGQRALHIPIECLPIAYVVAKLIVLLLLQRISLYDIATISTDSMVESTEYGFVLCDSNGRFLGGDVAAKMWFSEVNDLYLDRVVKEENTDFLKQMGRWIRKEDDREVVYIERNGKIIEVRHSILKEGQTKDVHCLYLRDDTKQQKYTQLMEQYNENLEKDVNAKTEKISHIQNDIIISMASIVENRDHNTGGHIARTSDVVRIFVDNLMKRGDFEELEPKIADCIVKAAPLHDFGKIAIPDRILNKEGKFDDDEYRQMKEHSAKGAVIVARILQNSEDLVFKNIAVNVAHYHHEKWDGKGYPEGLRGTEIPFEARVMALADVFDALVSKRVYKERFSYDKAFSIIEESCGTHFDPKLCKAFLECRKEFVELYDSYGDDKEEVVSA